MKRALIALALGLSMCVAYAMCEEPLLLTPAHLARLTEAKQRVDRAEAVLAVQQARYESELRQIALELHLNLDTHELKLSESGGKVAFSVKEKK